ncbi:hypothetical protein [Cyanobium sp. WAJ14-Wanaka]|uniref:hypothetical protein n=1 Tax=Cyanobium sp. WAJ14-Wanaka TaxID=2823725 RepID=UPI0020CFC55A|nr:hypothetical protein [Cyanobium sp. WAJ14-Wanaka]MCP9775524.1 hypothetical protein [Cyanobium sp. WAJ14-Wanaka]
MSNPTFFQPFVSTSVTIDSTANSLQGIKKNHLSPNSYLLAGTTGDGLAPPGYGALYIGAIDGSSTSSGSGSGTWYNFSVPSTWNPQQTSAYGPDILTAGTGPGGIGDVALTGTWINSSGVTTGWYYKGDISALNGDTSGAITKGFQNFQATTKNNSPANYTYLHSVDGGYVAGNYTTSGGPIGLTINVGPGAGSFVFNPLTNKQTNITYSDNATYHSTFGIWENDNNTYTVSGGASYSRRFLRNRNMVNAIARVAKILPDAALGHGMLADIDPITGIATNIHYYNYNNDNNRYSSVITHFQGIYHMGDDVYQAPFFAVKTNGEIYGGNAYIHRLKNGQFSDNAIWQTFEPTLQGSALGPTSVAGEANTGIFDGGQPFASIGSTLSYFTAAQILK